MMLKAQMKIAGMCLSAVTVGLVSLSSSETARQDIFDSVARNDLPKVESLLKASPGLINRRDGTGRTPVQLAAIYGYADLADLLIRSGADLDTRDSFGKSPLLNALRSEEPGIAARLLAAGAAVTVKGDEGRVLLHLAARTGCLQLLDIMAERGADLNTRNDDGGTLLHSVVRGRLAGWMSRLLAAKSDPNVRDRYSLTPLHLAARLGYLEGMGLLLSGGAEIEAKTVEGLTPYHIALENDKAAAAAELRAKGAEARGPEFPVLRGDYFGQKAPGESAEPYAVGIVSTMDWEHGGPVFSPDGSEMYWSPVVYGARRGCVMVSRRIDGRWTRPAPISFARKECREMGPGLSADGRRLYFTSYRPIDESRKEPVAYNLWVSEKKAGRWSDPRPLPSPVNVSPGTARSTLASGEVLYFGSWRTGRGAILRTQWRENRWLEPEVMPFNDDSPLICSYVSPDDGYLIFESSRPGGFGGFDLYIAFHNGDGTWSQAINLGDRINTPAQEWFASISHDGKYLFFTSNRNGNDDVYWIDARFLDGLRPKGTK